MKGPFTAILLPFTHKQKRLSVGILEPRPTFCSSAHRFTDWFHISSLVLYSPFRARTGHTRREQREQREQREHQKVQIPAWCSLHPSPSRYTYRTSLRIYVYTYIHTYIHIPSAYIHIYIPTYLHTHTLSRRELPDHMTVSIVRERKELSTNQTQPIFRAKLSPNSKVLDPEPEPEPEPEPGASSISRFQD